VVRFDIFEVDLRAGELRKEGRRIKLQEQPFRVLSLLLDRPGEVVTRDEIRQNLWQADTFVDFDHGLNSAVARLREALRDAADKPRFIETVAKRGYRFIGVLDDSAPAVSSAPDESHSFLKSEVAPGLRQKLAGPNGVPTSRRDAGATKFAPVRTWIAGVPLVVLLGAIGLWPFYRKTAETRLPSIEVMPLVGLRGFQVTPAFSPDGNQVAFRNSDGAPHWNLYGAGWR
jgi:DNA-binding winged helix-turn-helix (wHTH) protein